MQEEAPQQKFTGKIKAQILKQVFKDLTPKNVKGVEYFYLILKKQQIEMQFVSSSKEILIAIILKSHLFQSYNYNSDLLSLHKYYLGDFGGLNYFFENNKAMLDWYITQGLLNIKLPINKGHSTYVVDPLSCDQDDQDFLIKEHELRPEQKASTEIKLGKVSYLKNIVDFFITWNIDRISIQFQSQEKMLEVTSKADHAPVTWEVKVEEFNLKNFDSEMEFDSKALECALSLLPNDNELNITFYESFMLLDIPSKEKTFTIKISSKVAQQALLVF